MTLGKKVKDYTASARAGKPYLRKRISTVDLLVKIACFEKSEKQLV
jgi:hypothetical protein